MHSVRSTLPLLAALPLLCVRQEVLRLVDAYDMYGSVAYPKRHAQSDISDIYHLAAATRGVFVNVALQVGPAPRTSITVHAKLRLSVCL